MLSHTAQYALRAVVAIAEQPGGRPIGAARMATQLDIPRNYLSKTLHQLALAGVLRSSRGKLGGFQLARPAAQITLLDIVTHFDDTVGRRSCLMGRTVCSDHNPCAAHSRWKVVGDRAADFFRETTVAELVRTGRGGGTAASGSRTA